MRHLGAVFAGILLQEYSPKQRRLIGDRHTIFTGTAIGFTEAPHLYKRDGWYYLLTAEGGTVWGHAVTMARSRSLLGPYELHPDVYILSARHRPDAALQRAGHLYGRETIGSVFTQALVARRQQAHCFSASTIVQFEPQHFQQMAGLVCYYNSSKFHYFYISRDEGGKHLRVMSALPDQVTADAFTPPILVTDGVPIELRVEVDYERLHFAYRIGDAAWQWLPQPCDASILSDEATAPGLANFTGAFVGMACQDLAGTAQPADFDWFEYRERDYVAEVISEPGAAAMSAEQR
jgi:beta-xylosidase